MEKKYWLFKWSKGKWKKKSYENCLNWLFKVDKYFVTSQDGLADKQNGIEGVSLHRMLATFLNYAAKT
jgi:hypothetical protein